jgi:hypothetical protein
VSLSRQSRHRRLALLLGVLIGLSLGALFFTPLASATGRCHKQYCSRTFHLKPHQRRVWVTHAKVKPTEQTFLRVVIHGELVRGRTFGSCAAEFNAYGVVALADICINPGHITWILTDTLKHRATVTVSYAFLGAGIAN